MAEFVHIYSDQDPGETGEPSTTAPKRAAQVGATAYEANDVTELLGLFEKFKARNAVIDRMVIETHGSPGALYFGESRWDANALASFAAKGFEELFAENARMFLNGCNIAAIGRDCNGKQCTTVDGKAFLQDVERTFLFKGGGRVGASSSLGHVFPGFSSKVYHLPNTYYAYINKGGSKVRLAGGTELATPEGDWHIPEGNKTWLYRFLRNGEVRYQDLNGLAGKLGVLSLDDNVGKWVREGGAIKVSWRSGTVETWELPLFDGYQPIVWKRFDGRVQPLIAKRSYIGPDFAG